MRVYLIKYCHPAFIICLANIRFLILEMLLETHIGVSVIITIIICIIFYYKFRQERLNKYCENDAISVLKIVEELAQICPVGSHNQWILLGETTPRCWKHVEPIELWGFDVQIYGSSIIINGSPFATFKLIENFENWKEWKPDVSLKTFSVHKISDKEFGEDYNMDCVKVTFNNDDNEYYRFSYLGANEVGWVLVWDVKILSFQWFFFQPVHESELSHCLMTCIYGASSHQNVDKQLSFTVNAIKDAVEMHSVYNISMCNPLCLLSEDPSRSNCLITSPACRSYHQSSPVQWKAHKSNTMVLQLIPYFSDQYLARRRIKKFYLVPFTKICRDSSKSVTSRKTSKSSSYSLGKSKSSFEISKALYKSNMSSLRDELTGDKRSKSFIHLNHRKMISHHAKRSRTINADRDLKAENQLSSGWFSDSSFHAKEVLSDKRRSLDEVPEGERQEKNDTVPKTIILPETIETNKSFPEIPVNNYYSEDGQNTSDFEILLPQIELTDHRVADMITKGNFCASQLQAEVLKAEQIDRCLVEKGRSTSGRWLFNSDYKGATLLSKVAYCESLKIMSFMCQIDIPLKTSDVWKVIRCPHLRFLYDETVKKVRILEEISKDQKIIHTYHETGNLLKNEAVDFCLLHTERQEQRRYFLAIFSLEYPNCPLMINTTRGTLLPSGWVVEPHESSQEKSKVTYLYQVMVNKPNSLFIHDLGTSLQLSISNLKNYMMLCPADP